jgi:hypothetical protein
MEEAVPPDDRVAESRPVVDPSADGRVVIDFTVGPPGVGPVASITPVDLDELLAEQPPSE